MVSHVSPTDARLAEALLPVRTTSPETPPPNMDDKVTSQVSPPVDARHPETDAQAAKLDDTLTAKLEELIEEFNLEYQHRNISLRYSIDKKANSVVIKVMEADTEKLIRQVPPEAILSLKRYMRSLLGEIFDAQA